MLVMVSAAPAQFRMDDDMMPPPQSGGGRRGRIKSGMIIEGSVLDMARELRLSRTVIKKVDELLKEKEEKAAKREEALEIKIERLQDKISLNRSRGGSRGRSRGRGRGRGRGRSRGRSRSRARLTRQRGPQENLRRLQDKLKGGKAAEKEEKECAQKIIVLLTERQRTIWNTSNLTKMVLARLRSVRLDREQQDKVEDICEEAVKKIKKPTDVRFTPAAATAAAKQAEAKLLTAKQRRLYRRQERDRLRKEREAKRRRASRNSRGRGRGSRGRGRGRY